MTIQPGLSGVPETALWTLWFRSVEARRSDRVLDDPLAIELVERIDYPFAVKFGAIFPAQAQIQALRVLTFDEQVRRFLGEHPDGTVVALGEGLETQFWRVDNGRVRWLTVDLPQSVALRADLLPSGDRQRAFAGSALDPAWMDLVDPANGVLITAQGLLMYLSPDDVHDLIRACARRFPGGTMIFDSLPGWAARAAERGGIARGYRPPPLRWTLEPAEMKGLASLAPEIAEVIDVRPARGRGLLGRLVPVLRDIPGLRRMRPVIVALRFR